MPDKCGLEDLRGLNYVFFFLLTDLLICWLFLQDYCWSYFVWMLYCHSYPLLLVKSTHNYFKFWWTVSVKSDGAKSGGEKFQLFQVIAHREQMRRLKAGENTRPLNNRAEARPPNVAPREVDENKSYEPTTFSIIPTQFSNYGLTVCQRVPFPAFLVSPNREIFIAYRQD